MRIRHRLGLDSLRGLLRLYAVLLVSLPLGLAVLFFFFFQRGQVLDTAQAQLAASLAQERIIVDAWIRERVSDVTFLAGLDAVRQGNVAAMEAPFRNYIATYRHAAAVVYADPDGDTVMDTSGSPRVSVADRDYFKEAQAGRTTLVSGLIGHTSGKSVCIIAAPVTRPDGSFGGLVFLPMQLSSLDAWLRESTAGASASGGTILSDAAGRVLAPLVAVAAGPGAPRLSDQALTAGSQGARYTAADGREVLGATVSLEREGWRLTREVPVSAVLAGYRRQVFWVGLGALATLCCAIPVVSRLSGHLERPLALLTRHARELRESGYDHTCTLAPPGSMPREIETLFDAFCDMSCQIQAHIEEIERRSIEDALTGLHNRRFLFDSGVRILAATRRDGRPCACLMLDVDHFKAVNDSHGHQVGDHVLVHLAGLLVRSVRQADLLARYGGEEFVVLLPGTGAAQALELAERIRRNLAEEPFRGDGLTLPLTVSIGVAVDREKVEFGGGRLDDLLARADSALYVAKAAGRDRVVVSEA